MLVVYPSDQYMILYEVSGHLQMNSKASNPLIFGRYPVLYSQKLLEHGRRSKTFFAPSLYIIHKAYSKTNMADIRDVSITGKERGDSQHVEDNSTNL